MPVKSILSKGQLEDELTLKGIIAAGVDEVGRGCLAGPVVAACVVLNYNELAKLSKKIKANIRDSKTLSAKQRGEQITLIQSISIDHSVGYAAVHEIEDVGILNATFLAMNRAVAQIRCSIGMLLVDGHMPIRNQSLPQKPIIKGDSLCYTIAAASILAKEHRDQYMREQSEIYPEYGFASHVGYGTAAHLAAIKTAGICPMHRRTFAPVREMLELI